MENKALIMMAAYNGHSYIAQQIESIIKQSYTNWELYIRDDGSKDEKGEICNFYQEKDDHIQVLHKENIFLRVIMVLYFN